MKVFISWSGDISQVFAAALADWLPNVIQDVEPFLSSEDIRKGTGWFRQVSDELDQTNFGILCVTPDNKNAPWLLFEAGALAKKIQQSHVCPFLLGLGTAQLEGPLAQFQATLATRDDVMKLLISVNKALGDEALQDNRLGIAFEKNWIDLEGAIKKATDAITEKQKDTGITIKRTENDMLEELLDVTRGIGRQMEEIRSDIKNPVSRFARVATKQEDDYRKALSVMLDKSNYNLADLLDSNRASTILGMHETPITLRNAIPAPQPNPVKKKSDDVEPK